MLAPYWDQFPLVDGLDSRKPLAKELVPVKPKRDGSICSDGWRRLMFNFESVKVNGKRFGGFRFRYEGKDGDDLAMIFQTLPLGGQKMEWAIISSKGKMLSFPAIMFPKAQPGLGYQYLDSEFLETGETYLMWFRLDFDHPVEYRFRLALATVTPVMQDDLRQVIQTLADAAELDPKLPPAHPMTHMGIGITVAKQFVADKGLLVTTVMQTSAARKAELETYFLILKINGQSTADLSVSQFQTLLQDPTQGEVELTWRSNKHRIGEPSPIITRTIQKQLISGIEFQKQLESSRHLSLAAGMHEPGAAYRLGEIFLKRRYFSDAIKWFEKAAKLDDVKAMRALGHMYSDEQIEPDEKLATQWFTRAAELGDAISAYESACRYETGVGTAVDLAKAAAYFLQAAHEGNMEASTKIGEYYRLGKGVKQDQNLALFWLRKAAEQGNLDAAYQLGLNNLDLENYIEAARWFEKAAGGNKNPKAAVALGKLYEAGQGVNQSDIQAAKWFLKYVQTDQESRYHYALILRKKNNKLYNPRIAQIQLVIASRKGFVPAQQLLAQDGLDWTQLKIPNDDKPEPDDDGPDGND